MKAMSIWESLVNVLDFFHKLYKNYIQLRLI